MGPSINKTDGLLNMKKLNHVAQFFDSFLKLQSIAYPFEYDQEVFHFVTKQKKVFPEEELYKESKFIEPSTGVSRKSGMKMP
jgi:hypothetical protein